MKIRNLFDSNRDIYRTIEKVITYGASQENRIKAEISEYVVTDSIEEQFRKLLERMQLAMESGENEIGVWVSGFYGSGKSSFTKYLGLAFDNRVAVDGVPFIKHLQDRLKTPQVKALLSTVAHRFPAAVVMLDLASEMLAGATMADISSVLYFKVLQWAGYSRNLKVAALERRLERDGRFEEFRKKAEAQFPGLTWRDLQNDPLVVDGLIPQIAHDMYPALFPTPTSFTSSTEGFIQFEDQRVQEMLDIVREKSGKQHIIFIVDEVGQYIASRDHLILNLDGLAKNLKRLGQGKAWIISTAQQTLTEDDPRAALNSDKLYKLKDRFPIQIDLESSDIKEICYNRLLGKSAAGETELGKRFDNQGQALRHNTKLTNAKYYDSDFSRKTFIDLYPFLPAHFDILLHLLGALAKSTGGIGLRSAIKVIQDILVEGEGGRQPVADQPVGWIATTVTLYDTLDKDIRRAFPSIYHAVTNTCIRFHGSKLHEEVAKSIAILQILGNLPVTEENLASLMHPQVDASSRLGEVQKAVKEMLNDAMVPLGQKDGNLNFLSEKLRDIERERGAIPPRSLEVRRISNEALRECFNPLPRVSLQGTLAVTSGLRLQSGSSTTSLAGDQHPIQTVVEFTAPAEHDSTRTRLREESRNRQNQNTIYLLARSTPNEELALEVYRCMQIAELHRNDPDQEVREYCTSQLDRAEKIRTEQLIPQIKRALTQGSFVFHGESTAVTALNDILGEASCKILSGAASAACILFSNKPVSTAASTLFANFTRSTSPAFDLLEILDATPEATKRWRRRIMSMRMFGKLPFHMLSYWMPDSLFRIFEKNSALKDKAYVTLGLDTRGNEERLYRLWWEPDFCKSPRDEWPVVTVGGTPQHFYRDSHMVVNWYNDAAELGVFASAAAGGTFTGRDHYFRRGLTYIFTGQTTFSLQPLAETSVFAKAAHAVFPKCDSDLLPFTGLLNSEPVRLLLKVINPNRFFQTAYVKLLPIPGLTRVSAELAELSSRSIDEGRLHARRDECSRLFIADWTVECASTPESVFDSVLYLAEQRADRLSKWKKRVDDLALDTYGIPPDEMNLLQKWVGESTAQRLPGEIEVLSAGRPFIGASMISYLVGCAFGRWNVSFATGNSPLPDLPDPFAPLLVCPHGQLQNELGLPITKEEVETRMAEGQWNYPINIPWDGILVDAPSHSLGIQARVHQVLQVIWKDRWEAIEREACETLDVPTLSDYFHKPVGFFADHLKRYSKSRRQAPIYWPLSTASGSYTLWLYYHRLTDQTLYACVNEYVDPKLRDVSDALGKLRAKGMGRNRNEEKELERLHEFELDLQEFRDELLRLAKLPWRPNLNDGVQITAAPIWQLFRLPKWQKTLKETWEKLDRGDYDWAHLAYTLWPDRVSSKCKTDKSLAIAHGLEELYVEPPAAKKKRKRQPVVEEVLEMEEE